ncbi:hypothetical protein [Amphritea sp.]|uniref:hypothetical protein n=1 Tax=Amphritea sp. TaxID=1872502 RepID=UPI003D0C18A7
MLKKLIKKFLTLPIFTRISISLFVSVIAGLGVGVISEYAAYSYALNIGVRPPFEGIPYLGPTVSAFTILLLLGLFVAFSLMYFFVGLPLYYIRKMFERIVGHSEEMATNDEEFERKLINSIKLALKPHRVWAISMYGINIDPVRESIDRNDDPITTIDLMNKALLSAKILNPMIPIWIASVSSLVVVITLSLLLFLPKVYSKLLCSMTYGGNIPVTLYLKNDGISPVEKEEGKLIIRSNTAITIQTDSVFREYPEFSVGAIEYAPGYSCLDRTRLDRISKR